MRKYIARFLCWTLGHWFIDDGPEHFGYRRVLCVRCAKQTLVGGPTYQATHR